MRSNRVPPVTLVFIGACIFAAFAVLVNPDIVNVYGFSVQHPNLLTAFVSLFLHQNVLHLLGNMIFLAAIGPAVEEAAGSIKFAAVYLVGGFVGIGAHWLLASKGGDPAPLIGASGCIAAIAAYYALRYLTEKVPFAPKINVPVYAIVAVWLLLQILGAFVNIGVTGGQVAYWAHLGGFATGLGMAFLFGAPKHAYMEQSHEMLDRMTARSPAAQLAAAEHHLKAHPNDLKAMREKREALMLLGDSAHETETIIELLDALRENDQAPMLSRLAELNNLDRLPTLRRALMAERVKQANPDLCRKLLISVADESVSDDQRPDALLALYALDRESEPAQAQAWLKELVTSYPLHPASEVARKRGWTP